MRVRLPRAGSANFPSPGSRSVTFAPLCCSCSADQFPERTCAHHTSEGRGRPAKTRESIREAAPATRQPFSSVRRERMVSIIGSNRKLDCRCKWESSTKSATWSNATTESANNPVFVLQLGSGSTYLVPLGSIGVNRNTRPRGANLSRQGLSCYIPRDSFERVKQDVQPLQDKEGLVITSSPPV